MKFTPVDSIEKLNIGDVIKSGVTGLAYVVTANYGNRVTAVRTVDITNIIEWQVLSKHKK